MLAEITHNSLHILSYHTNFRNTTSTASKVDPSILTTGERISFSGATGTIGREGFADSSKKAMFSERPLGPTNALSSAHSIVVPTLSSQMGSSSCSNTATSRVGLTDIVVSSKWNNSSNIAVPTTTNAEPYQWMSMKTGPMHCVSAKYSGQFSSPCSTFNRGNDDATARDNPASSLNSVSSTANRTAWSSCTEVQGLPTSSVIRSGDDAKQPVAQATQSRGWEDVPVTTTEAQISTVPDQSLGKSQYAGIDGSGIRPYDPTTNITHLVSTSFMSQTSICTSETWRQMNFSHVNIPSEAATNDTLAAPSTTPSPMPTFASTAQLDTAQCIWVMVCLGAIVLFYI